MRKKNVKTTLKSKISVSDLLFKTTFGIPIFMTNLLFHTGELIIDKSIAFLSGENKKLSNPELLSGIHASGKNAPFSEASTNDEEIFGLRPYGPKIYIRK